jgi:hypothetical protein
MALVRCAGINRRIDSCSIYMIASFVRRFKLQQLCQIFEEAAASGGPLNDMSLLNPLYYGLLGHTHSYAHLAGCTDLVLQRLCSLLCTLHTARA